MNNKQKKEHYVNNAEFLEGMKAYKKRCRKAKREGKEKPPVDNYLGSCFLKIANHLSYRPNFINYTFKDDMISDGIENCLQYLDNFDPLKSKNPFAYFTQIIFYAFIRRIQKEKKQVTIKHRLIMDNNLDDMVLQPGDRGGDYTNQFKEFLQKNIRIEETPKKEKKPRKKKSTVSKFFV
jgi:hypothetical protein